MDDVVRGKIQKIIEEQDDCSRKVVLKQVSALCAEHSQRGLIRSGATLKSALKIFEEQTSHFIASLVTEIAPMKLGSEGFGIIAAGLNQFLLFLEGELKRLVKVTGDIIEKPAEAQRLGAAVANIWTELRGNLMAELEQHRSAFVTMPAESEEDKADPDAEGDREHNPMALYWHQMWADTAIQLLTGDLQPDEEADIARSMQQWFADHEVEIRETEMLDCAHLLWRNYEAALQQAALQEADGSASENENHIPGFALLDVQPLQTSAAWPELERKWRAHF